MKVKTADVILLHSCKCWKRTNIRTTARVYKFTQNANKSNSLPDEKC